MDYYSSLDSRSLDSVPTIFEIISSNELESLLSPSVRYIIVHYAQKYPKYLLRLALKFDEFNLIFRGAIEYYHLKYWNSSFTEKFYGLKRQSMNTIQINDKYNKITQLVESKKRLSNVQIVGSLISVVGTTYITEKLDVVFEKLYAKYLMKSLKPNDFKSSMKYYFIKIYPHLISSIKLLNILFQIFYLAGKTKSPSLVDYLLKIEYSRLNQFDYQLNESSGKSSQEAKNKPERIRPPSFGEVLVQTGLKYYVPLKTLLFKSSTSIFPLAIFMLKFLEWWSTSEFAQKISKKQNSINREIPPPKHRKKSTLSDKCPICGEVITNPAVIETGYVFCYRCITRYLFEGSQIDGGRCPISGQRLLGCEYSNSLKQWKVEGIRRLMI